MLHQKKGNKESALYKSTMVMMRVMAKQMHQKDMDQLPMAPLRKPMSATSEKATQVEKSCGRRRQQHMANTASPGYVDWVDMVL